MENIINTTDITAVINTLQPHPFAEKLYRVNDIELLMKSIAKDGLLEPVLIDPQSRIIAGRRRWIACKKMGWKNIPVKVLGDYTELQLEQLIITSNQQRKKTKAEIFNEVEHILGVLGKSQGQRRDLIGKDDTTETFGKIGKDRFEIAAATIGNEMSAATLRRLMHVKQFEQDNPDAKLGLVDKLLTNELTIARAKKLATDYIAALKERDGIKTIELTPVEKHNSDNYIIHNKTALNMYDVADAIIQMIMTSVPYYSVRKYGIGYQAVPELGLENTYQAYIINLTEYLKEMFRVLSLTGSLFLNIGDTYAKNKNYLISSRLVLAACDLVGFHCVNEIIWHKTNVLPQTTTRRLQPSYEKIYHLVKDPDNYYYEPFLMADKDKDIKLYKMSRRNNRGGHDKSGYALTKPYKKFSDFINQQELNDIIISPSAGADNTKLHQLNPEVDHPAIFPSSICVLPILTTTKPGDLILDPFSGSGTVGETALLLGRKYIGYEIEERFSALSIQRLTEVEKSIDPQGVVHIQNMGKPATIIDATCLAHRDEKAA